MSDNQLYPEINQYKFTDSLNLFLTFYALCEIKKYELVVTLYEKYKDLIKESGNEVIGLQTIVNTCSEKKEGKLFEIYSRQFQKKILKTDT